MSLTIAPIGLRAANAYVTDLHRHHGPTRGHKFSIACLDDDRLLGSAEPAARRSPPDRTEDKVDSMTTGGLDD